MRTMNRLVVRCRSIFTSVGDFFSLRSLRLSFSISDVTDEALLFCKLLPFFFVRPTEISLFSFAISRPFLSPLDGGEVDRRCEARA